MASGVGGLAGPGAADDKRLHHDGLDATTLPARLNAKLHDKSIPFEEYLHYAKITRADEDRLYGPGSDFSAGAGPVKSFFQEKIMRKHVDHAAREAALAPRLSVSAQGEGQIARHDGSGSDNEKNGHDRRYEPMVIGDEEWIQASRAARTATW